MDKSECYKIILRPSISESSFDLIDEKNTLTFIVAPTASKGQIKQALKILFDVTAIKVNTMITRAGIKKAFVRLHPNNNASDLAIRLKLF